MNDGSRVRATLAVGLLVLATAGPLIKWYFAGREAADREGSRIEARARTRENAMATRFASAAAARLEHLREDESRRPWPGHRPLLGDPGLRDPGSLEDPPADPLVASYFILDTTGLTSLARHEGSASLGPGDGSVVLHAATHCVDRTLTRDDIEPPPFEWRSLKLGASRHLTALRCIISPNGRIVEGFVVDPRGLEPLLRDVAMRLGPVTPSLTATRLPLAGGEWAVRVSNAELLAEAAEHAELVHARFLQTFLLGAALALLAGMAGVLLVLGSHAASRRRSELAAAAAHELRTPLASIRLHAELAESSGDDESLRRHVRIVALEAERLGRVVTNVLAFARLESGTQGRKAEPCCAGTIVREVFERQRELLEARGMTVALKIDDGLPTVLADADSVAEILSNLLDNAERHSRGADERLARVEVCRSGDGGVDVSVVDSGTGMPDGFLARGIKPFRRGETSSGLGLGLAISTALARAMGGALVLGPGPAPGPSPGPAKGTSARLTLRPAATTVHHPVGR